MHILLGCPLVLVVLWFVMFSKLVTPTKKPRKATLRDFLVEITPEKEPPAVQFVSFAPTPPHGVSSQHDDHSHTQGSFLQDIKITPETEPRFPFFSNTEKPPELPSHEHSPSGST